MMKAFLPTLAAALLASQPALAADAQSWKVGSDSFHIYYSDLDLNTEAGRVTMLKRVERAARKLCDDRLKTDEDACVAATLAQAAQGPRGDSLRMAMRERGQVRVARR
jgi:UrcA family protein